MVCSVCGKKGHNIRQCPLPGAGLLLAAKATLSQLGEKSSPPQAGRKPPRMALPTYGQLKSESSSAYSGQHAKQVRRKKDRQRRRKQAEIPASKEMQLRSVAELQRLGYMPATPKCCRACRKHMGDLFVINSQAGRVLNLNPKP